MMRLRALLAVLLPACLLLQAFCLATAAASDALSGPHVFGWGLSLPISDSSDGTHVWVANIAGHSVTELDAATGALVRVIAGPQYGFGGAIAVSSDGTHVWVANRSGGTTRLGSVTELDAATGALVRVITGAQYGFNTPYAVSSDGTHVWVANFANGGTASEGASVTELSAATGALVQVIAGPSYGFSGPESISSDGTHVWVTNPLPVIGGIGNSVTELSAATGALVQVISGLDGPDAVSSDGTHVWVANFGSDFPAVR